VAQQFNYEFAALVIVDAMVLGDRKAAEIHGVSPRTVKRYRNRFKTDPKLTQLVTHLRQTILQPKKPRLEDAIASTIEWIEDAPKHLDRDNPDHLEVITRAFKTLSEINLANRMIDARLAALPGQTGTGNQQMVSRTIEVSPDYR
jgi:hypothetical protein